jgi:hypothetical protein
MTTTVTIADKAINTTYQDKTGTTSGAGTGAKFDVTKTNGVYSVVLDGAVASAGTGYAAGDTVTILGSALGGVNVTNDLILTVATVGAGGKIATFGAVGTGRVGDGIVDIQIDVTGTTSVDTYAIPGKSTEYTITNDLTNKAILADSTLVTGAEFKLADHERVVFTDKAIAFDITGTAGDVYALLKASIGTVNSTYEGIGIKMEDAGTTSEAIASAILGTTAFKVAAGGSGNDSFVKQVYTNVMGVAPTLAQQTVFTDMLNAHTVTQAQLLVAAAHLTTFQQTIGLVGVAPATTGVLAGTGIDFIPA